MKQHSVSAGAVVVRHDRHILAVRRRDTGAWVTPGGIVEPGESISEATIREVFEETGVRVILGGLSGIYQNLSTDVVTFVFRAEPVDTSTTSAAFAQNDAETATTRWLLLDDVDNLMRQPFIMRVYDAVVAESTPRLRVLHEPHIMAPR